MTVTYYIERKRNGLPIAKENTTPGTRSTKGIEIRMVWIGHSSSSSLIFI